jgi:biopolymer transport protein ExbD
VVNLEIDFDGTPIWNGTPVTSRAQLDRFLEETASQIPQPEVHLRPNRLAKYDAVARTLADAQRLGVTKIGFVGNEQYIE